MILSTGPYGQASVDEIDNATKNLVKDKHVLIYGSQTPWIEVILLENGAKKITAVDYKKLQSEDSRVETIDGHEFNRMYLNDTLPQFDVMLTFSSLEHSGLGRYLSFSFQGPLKSWQFLIFPPQMMCAQESQKLQRFQWTASPKKTSFDFDFDFF